MLVANSVLYPLSYAIMQEAAHKILFFSPYVLLLLDTPQWEAVIKIKSFNFAGAYLEDVNFIKFDELWQDERGLLLRFNLNAIEICSSIQSDDDSASDALCSIGILVSALLQSTTSTFAEASVLVVRWRLTESFNWMFSIVNNLIANAILLTSSLLDGKLFYHTCGSMRLNHCRNMILSSPSIPDELLCNLEGGSIVLFILLFWEGTVAYCKLRW